ncbi:MAG: hypothetical protein L3J67_02390 [Hyphomicrobiaceae bacterium]|nr:hypothetical protein [Hyphomicrobiaceae bacterium]
MIGGLLKSTSSLAILAAAGMFVGGLAISPAQAADLGGDCCADLEERVADLEATTARKGNRKVSLKISGWITRQMGWLEDTTGDSEFYSSGTFAGGGRLKFSGSAKLSANWKAGYVLRFRTNSDRVGKVLTDAGRSAGAGLQTIDKDLDYAYLSSSQLGTFVVGQAYAPSKSISNISLGGHGALENAGDKWNALSIKGFELEQNSALQAVAWISPTFAGFTFAAAWADLDNAAVGSSGVDAIDVALRYANEFGPIRIAAGIAYTANDDNGLGFNDGSNVTGSVALMHTPTGLNVDFAAGKENSGGVAGTVLAANDTSDKQFWHVAAGINQNFFGPGNTSIYGEYGNYDYDQTVAGNLDQVDMWGLGIVQHFDSAATEVWVAYRQWDGQDVAGANPTGTDGDVQQLSAGMRIKF